MTNVYGNIITKGKFDINKDELFFSLKECDELLITRELTNFMVWSNTHLDLIDDLLQKEGKKLFELDGNVNTKVLTEFWLDIIGKSNELEEIIKDVSIIADIYTYIEKYYKQMTSLTEEFDFRMVSKSIFRTEEQKIKLLHILNKHDYKSFQLQSFFNTRQVNVDHIDRKNAENLISRLS